MCATRAPCRTEHWASKAQRKLSNAGRHIQPATAQHPCDIRKHGTAQLRCACRTLKGLSWGQWREVDCEGVGRTHTDGLQFSVVQRDWLGHKPARGPRQEQVRSSWHEMTRVGSGNGRQRHQELQPANQAAALTRRCLHPCVLQQSQAKSERGRRGQRRR